MMRVVSDVQQGVEAAPAARLVMSVMYVTLLWVKQRGSDDVAGWWVRRTLPCLLLPACYSLPATTCGDIIQAACLSTSCVCVRVCMCVHVCVCVCVCECVCACGVCVFLSSGCPGLGLGWDGMVAPTLPPCYCRCSPDPNPPATAAAARTPSWSWRTRCCWPSASPPRRVTPPPAAHCPSPPSCCRGRWRSTRWCCKPRRQSCWSVGQGATRGQGHGCSGPACRQ